MVRHLFRDFLVDEHQYREAEKYWGNCIGELAIQMGQEGEWLSWMPRSFVNGTPLPRDGNPIVERRNDRIGRALQIIQSPPESDEVEVSAWLRAFNYADSGGPGFTEELTINLSLSDEAADVARKLLSAWMDESVSRERMEEMIRTFLNSL